MKNYHYIIYVLYIPVIVLGMLCFIIDLNMKLKIVKKNIGKGVKNMICKNQGHPYRQVSVSNEGYTIHYKCTRCKHTTSVTTPSTGR